MSHEGSVDLYGSPGPRGVMLLHGAAVNRRMWREIGPFFAPTWPVIAPDLPGHGELRRGSFRLSSAVDRLVGLLDEHGVDRAVLVGESLGGYVALAAAPACGPRLAGLVLSGATLNPTGPTGGLLRAYAGTIDLAAVLLGDERVQAWTEDALRRSYPEAPHAEILACGLSPRGRSEALREVIGRDFLARLPDIEAPVLVLNGSRDLVNRLGERAFLRGLARGELHHLEGMGHGAAMACPAVFREELTQFLEECVGA